MKMLKELSQKLISWIKQQVEDAGCKGLVLGLSGGLDSSVAAVLCKHAFPNNTLGVLLPCYSNESDLSDAKALTSKFDIHTVTIVLDSVYDLLSEALSSEGYDPRTKKVAQANLKPRLRMTTLYCIANQLGYLVAGTSNRSEISVGYFTKHGDGSADILPLGNLVKGQVRELAEYLGVPDEIIKKTPSAGLWSGQTDEEEMELSYKELDRYLISGEGSEELRKRVETLAKASAHKRKPAPIPPFNS